MTNTSSKIPTFQFVSMSWFWKTVWYKVKWMNIVKIPNRSWEEQTIRASKAFVKRFRELVSFNWGQWLFPSLSIKKINGCMCNSKILWSCWSTNKKVWRDQKVKLLHNYFTLSSFNHLFIIFSLLVKSWDSQLRKFWFNNLYLLHRGDGHFIYDLRFKFTFRVQDNLDIL